MYSLDINFLKERQAEGQAAARAGGAAAGISLSEQMPLIAGGAAGLLVPAAIGLWWMQLNQQTAQVNQEIAQLQDELSQLEASQEQIAALEAERDAALAQAEQLTNIFEQIRPVSAVLQDVRDRLPSDVQVASLRHQQSGENVSISLSGVGRSFESINHFVLTLERSPFIDPETLQLQGVGRANYPGSPGTNTVPGVSPESVVSYGITFRLNQMSASQLLGQLEAKGATGLATRIKTLQAKGLIE